MSSGKFLQLNVRASPRPSYGLYWQNVCSYRKIDYQSPAWLLVVIILKPVRLRQEGSYRFEASLDYIVSSRPAKAA